MKPFVTNASHIRRSARMTTPTVVQFDHNAPPPPLSPLVDYVGGRSRQDGTAKKNKEAKNVDANNYKEIKVKYQDAKKRVDRLKQEREQNKRILLEMSSVISALKDITVDYEPVASASDQSDERSGSILNIHNKIRAFDTQLKMAMIQCGNLEQEKELQSSTIMAQQLQIRGMEDQINELRQQLSDAVKEENRKWIASEKKALEVERDGLGQQGKMIGLDNALKYQLGAPKNNLSHQIEEFQGAHEAKYAEIQAMERQLRVLREAQSCRLPTSTRSPKSKPGRRVKFTLDEMELKLGRKQSQARSSDGSESCSSTHCSPLSDAKSDLEVTSEGDVDHEHNGDDDHSVTTSDSVDLDIYADERGADYSTRSAVVQGGGGGEDDGRQVLVVVNAGTDKSGEDESVEITMNKRAINPYSEESVTSEETFSSRSPDPSNSLAEEYHQASVKLMELKLENENLRRDHLHALANMAQISELTSQAEQTKKEYENLKRVMEEQKQSMTLVQTKYVKMVQQHGKLVEELRDEKAKYAQLMEDYGKTAHRQSEVERYDELKEMHDKVVTQLAQLGDNKERLLIERNDARKQRDQAVSLSRTLATENEATTSAYKALQEQNDNMIRKVSAMSTSCDEYKTKYYELLASSSSIPSVSASTHSRDERYETLRCEYESVLSKLHEVQTRTPSVERLEREKSEALAKITVLEQSNREFVDIRERYHAAEAKAILLERDVTRATEEAKKAKKGEEQKALFLKDLLSHYRTLEAEHEEVRQKLVRIKPSLSGADAYDDRLRLGPAGLGALADQAKAAAYHSKMTAFEERIKAVQQQRDAAMDQTTQLEEELNQAQSEKTEAIQSRKEREQDLKSVLGHYRDLQKSHDDLKEKTTRLEQQLETERTHHTGRAVLAEKEPEAHRSEIFSSSIYERKGVEDVDMDMNSETPDERNGRACTVAEAAMAPMTTTMDVAGGDGSVTRLLIDMEELKRVKESSHNLLHPKKRGSRGGGSRSGSRSDELSSVSNVTEGLSLDDSRGGDDERSSVLSDEAPSTTWKDVKIAKLLTELEVARTLVVELEEREKIAQEKLESTERLLLVANQEASDAQKRQGAREVNLRDAIAQQHRLQGEYDQVKELVSTLQDQLEQAKTKARLAEEETKSTRRRATEYHNQFKKLQERHQDAMRLIEEQERYIEMLEHTTSS